MSREPHGPAPRPVSFTKAFVPGLIVGLILGVFAGGFITPLLDKRAVIPASSEPEPIPFRLRPPPKDEAPKSPTEPPPSD